MERWFVTKQLYLRDLDRLRYRVGVNADGTFEEDLSKVEMFDTREEAIGVIEEYSFVVDENAFRVQSEEHLSYVIQNFAKQIAEEKQNNECEIDNQPNQQLLTPKPDQPKPDQPKGDRIPFGLVFIVITVIWAWLCSLEGQRFPIEIFLLGEFFGVSVWSFFAYDILNP